MPNVAKPKFIYAVFDPSDGYSMPLLDSDLNDVADNYRGRWALEDLVIVRYVPDSVGTLAQPKVRYEIKKTRKT